MAQISHNNTQELYRLRTYKVIQGRIQEFQNGVGADPAR